VIRRLAILASAALLAGCALVINVGYSLVDTALVWYVRDYFPLDTRQEATLKAGLAEVRQWHCETQLPRYSAWLRAVGGELQRGITREDVGRRAAEIQAHWREVLERLAPVLARTFATATDAQIAELAANFANGNREYRGEWVDLPPEALARKRYERAVKQFSRWIGGLNAAQADEVRRWSERFDPTGAEWAAYRERWQAAFVETLKGRAQPAAYGEAVARLFVDYDATWSPELRRRIAANRGATLDMIHDVARLMSDAQRVQAAERAESYAREFDRLACAAPQGAAAATR
jgi:hypothetical protein